MKKTKVIDFSRKGNVVRFYLGKKELDKWYGDDWDDAPYDCNAGQVYDEFIDSYVDISFKYDCKVLEPCDGHGYGNYCPFTKEDMIKRKVPCIIVVPEDVIKDSWEDSFTEWVGSDKVAKFYFGDSFDEMLDKMVSVIGIEIQRRNYI